MRDRNGDSRAVEYRKRELSAMHPSATESVPGFRRLLLATDFSMASQAAFRSSLEWCLAFGASLLVLHVCEYAKTASPDTGGFLIEQQVLCQRCRDGLEEMRQTALGSGVECEVLMENGNASACILDVIERKQIDLTVLGTRALHGFERLVFGSTAETVLRNSPCPVLTVGPRVKPRTEAGRGDRPVIFATDFDFNTMQAIRYAASFSNLTSSPLHCLHVLPRTLEDGTESEIVPAIMSGALQQLASESGVTMAAPTCATTYGSEVSYAVVDYAREQRANLIVLGVRQASLLASQVPEHITYRVITEASCPVLTMAFGYGSHSQHAQARVS
jgi:nucleotide-binding universal stress UspA family protein